VAGPTQAQFDELKLKVEDPATGLPAVWKQINEPGKGLMAAMAAIRLQIDNPDTGLARLNERLTKIENPSWFKSQMLKGDMQLAATHAQAFKLDYSALKFDEKGLTLFGRPILGGDKLSLGFITDWINKKLGMGDGADGANRVITGVQRQVTVLHARLGEVRSIATATQMEARKALIRGGQAGAAAQRAQTRADQAFARAGQARIDANEAKGRADQAIRRAGQAKQWSDNAMREVRALRDKAQAASGEIRHLQNSIERLDAALR